MLDIFKSSKSKRFDIRSYIGAKEKTIIVDYYERTVGTPMKMPFYELVLYTHSDTHALLEEYSQGGMDDETVTSYLVPLDEAQSALDTIKKCGMADWHKRPDTVAICGRAYVCKFPDGEGGLTRVTGEKMPESGHRDFGSVKAALISCMKKEYLV